MLTLPEELARRVQRDTSRDFSHFDSVVERTQRHLVEHARQSEVLGPFTGETWSDLVEHVRRHDDA